MFFISNMNDSSIILSTSKRPDLQLIEKKWQEWWQKEGVYDFDKHSNKPVYSIDTPPPTVSGSLHVGHAMSYSQAEFIARYKRMQGFNVFYPMGFDDNGLPTERFVESKLGINLRDMNPKDFIGVVEAEVAKAREEFKSVWKKLGISVDWRQSYSTISPEVMETSQKSFIKLYENGRAYRKKDAAIWCPTCRTSLAQADLENREEHSKLNYLDFHLEDGDKFSIATTRPEMLGACVSVFVNPNDSRYSNIVGKYLIVPIYNNRVPVLSDTSIDPEFGTGVVMVCTFGDRSDIDLWRKYNLPSKIIIQNDGRFDGQAGSYVGLNVNETRRAILEELFDQSIITRQEDIVHEVPVHERCENHIQFNIQNQWFVKILDLKDALIRQGEKIEWYPPHMKNVYESWVKGLKWDWNISRQRPYGVPFPVWYCNDCGIPIIADEKEVPVDPRVTKYSKSCPSCGDDNIAPETDVMDTWMASSLTPLINAHWDKKNNLMNLIYPMNLRPQAHEIIRTWAFYTILKSYIHTDALPWKAIMISGHGLDARGRKMSKSKGNVILPEDVINKYSADALRWWAAGIKLGDNLPFQEKDVVRGKDITTKLWNAIRFSSNHIVDGHDADIDELKTSDRWILAKLNYVIQKTTEDFEAYQYSNARDRLENFFWHDFCDNYLEIVKHRLYGEAVPRDKRGAQYTLYNVLLSSLQLLAPFMPHITEEIYQGVFRKYEGYKSIHISRWPKHKPKWKNEKAEELGDLEVETISELRRWKHNHDLSLGSTINNLTLTHPEAEKLKQVEDEIRGTVRIKELRLKDGEFSIEMI